MVYINIKMDNFQKDDDVRPPDKVFKERLIQDTRSEFEKQIDETLYKSLQELKIQDEINMTFEEELIKTHTEEYNTRIGKK